MDNERIVRMAKEVATKLGVEKAIPVSPNHNVIRHDYIGSKLNINYAPAPGRDIGIHIIETANVGTPVWSVEGSSRIPGVTNLKYSGAMPAAAMSCLVDLYLSAIAVSDEHIEVLAAALLDRTNPDYLQAIASAKELVVLHRVSGQPIKDDLSESLKAGCRDHSGRTTPQNDPGRFCTIALSLAHEPVP